MRTIAQISDLHFGRHDRRIADDLLASLGRDRPDLVAVSGDLTQRALRSEFLEARAFLDRISPCKLIVPGNHDVPLYNLLSRFGTPLGLYQRFIAPAAITGNFYHDEEIAIFGLNTTRRLLIKRGRVSLQQMADVQRAFGALSSSVFKIVMTHHPLAAPAGGPAFTVARRAPAVLKASAENSVHLLLSGHRHSALSGQLDVEVLRRGAILMVHAGTAISTRTRGGETNSYNLLQIEAGQVTIAVKAWSAGEGFRAAQTTTYRLENGTWHTTS